MMAIIVALTALILHPFMKVRYIIKLHLENHLFCVCFTLLNRFFLGGG